jgi:hypothetical protein
VFRVPLLVALSLVIAFGGGVLITLYALDVTAGFGAIRLGVWEAFPYLHTAEADPYAKSHRARAGRLLYGTAEGLVFTAIDDSGGNKLDPACDYRISGQTPPARLWTLFAAGDDGKPLLAPAGRPGAINSWTVLRDANSNFVVTVSRQAQAGNWLALSPAAGRFRLVLTLLDTPVAGSTGLMDLAMPAVEKIGCAHA